MIPEKLRIVDADTLLKTNTEIALFATVSKAEDK